MERLKELLERLVTSGKPGESMSASEFHELHDGVMELIEKLNEVIISCVYCGKEFPKGTPAHGSDVETLTEHIKVCPLHPLRETEETITKLRKGLLGLVGCEDTIEELDAMDVAMRLMPGVGSDKIAALNAIHVLRDTHGK